MIESMYFLLNMEIFQQSLCDRSGERRPPWEVQAWGDDEGVLVEFGWKETGVDYLGGGFKYFLFSPLLGEMIQFD